MIEPIPDVVYLCFRQRIHVRSFGHILANQPVGVLVESTLPSMVGMGKIDGRVQRLADRGMVGKLLAIIGCNRLGMPLMGREQRNGRRRYVLGLFGGDFAQDGIARAPFDHRDEGPGALGRPSPRSISQSPMRLFSSTMAGRWVNTDRGL